MNPYNCVIIEDSFIDRLLIEEYVKESPLLKLLASCENPIESLDILNSGKVDLIFLDIDIPVINGVDFFKKISCRPLCCFITSHPEYAIEAFDINAFDYILKPVKKDRFEQTIRRLEELRAIKTKAEQYHLLFEQDCLMVKEGTSISKVMVKDVVYLEALTNYTKIVTAERTYITLMNLSNFLNKLPKEKFLRIHRSYAVAVKKVQQIESAELKLMQFKLPIGKTYRHDVNQVFRNSL
jgi:DNA-binding LytR/AlgR family response regulator